MHRSLADGSRQEGRYHISQGVDPVHEYPEAWQMSRTGENTAEDVHQDEHDIGKA